MKTWLLIGCAATAIIMTTAAHAQITVPERVSDASAGTQSTDEAASVPGEIVVTAQGRTQRLRDVPISASIVTGEALTEGVVLKLEDLALRLPNFKIATASISDFVVVRGVGSSLNLGFEQSVGTFVDGIYRGRSRTTRVGLFDVERVELLKGPQTIFFGNNTIAGAINVSTRKPGDDLEANGSVTFIPSTMESVVEAGASVPVADNLSFRLAGRVSGTTGYIYNSNFDTKGPNESHQIGRFSMAWQPSATIEVDARLDVGRSRDKYIANYELLMCPPPTIFGAPAAGCARYLSASGGVIDNELDRRSQANRSYFNYDFADAAWTTRVSLGDLTLSAITGYFNHSYDSLYDPVPIPANMGGSVVGTSQTVATRIGEDYQQFSQEFRLASPDENDFSYIAGAYYQRSKLEVDQFIGLYFAPFGNFTNGLVPGSTPVATRVAVSERTNVYSAFVSGTYRFSPALRLNAGVRYSRTQKLDQRAASVGTSGASIPSPSNFTLFSSAAQSVLLRVTGTDAGNFALNKRSDDKFLPSVSVQFDATPDVMIYGSYTKGFKAGGFSIGTSAATFDPERVDAYEIGVKSSLLGGKAVFNIAAFHSTYDNLQETSTIIVAGSGAARQIVGNVASSIAKGVEVSATLRPFDGLTLTGDIAYLSSKYDKYPNAPCTSVQAVTIPNCVQNLSGRDRPFAPEFSGNVGANYQTYVSDDLSLGLNANMYFMSDFLQQPTSDPRLFQPGNAKVDGRISITSDKGQWEFAVVGRNLTNKLTASYRQIVPSAAGSIAALADPPRSIGVQLTFRR